MEKIDFCLQANLEGWKMSATSSISPPPNEKCPAQMNWYTTELISWYRDELILMLIETDKLKTRGANVLMHWTDVLITGMQWFNVKTNCWTININ